MNDIFNLIKFHINKYPLITNDDIYKLLYQMEFGSNHFVNDETKSLNNLVNEINNIDVVYDDTLAEYLGKKYVRIYLFEYNKNNYDIKLLNKYFVKSAKLSRSIKHFKKIMNNVSSYFNIKFNDYNYKAIHHSNIYNNNYHPHYRVINKKYLKKLFKE